MDKINLRQFLVYQPNGEVEQSSDKAYLALANKLYRHWEDNALFQEAPDDLKKVVCIGIVGYYQDIISDAGLWRSFIDQCKQRYGNYVPFHKDNEEYILYELNLADVEFVVWYYLAFNSMQFRFLSPSDTRLLKLANALYHILEDEYDEIPSPENYKSLMDCEFHNPEDTEKLYDLGQWLFWRNWLLFPPFQLSYSQIYSQIVEIQHSSPSQQIAAQRIEELQQEVMTSMPTGPLALYLREWMSLVLDGKLPTTKQQAAPVQKEHPYYTAFVKANNGMTMRFVKTYDKLNDFFINGMGWEKDEDHLPQFKGHSDFVLMVTIDKGLMLAKDIAKCIKHPENPLYEKEYAEKFAFTLLSQRAVCPSDMLLHICNNGWLPDARFPESVGLDVANQQEEQSTNLVKDNWDFIARVYLQEFYRADL
ncbi:MAG: DUF3843 family protein [Prevotella sp.]|nr:DUF3843 family protein [Prevotella sp.]MCM1074722.1 DUF3843 family protein [Ruminococcus sp.]